MKNIAARRKMPRSDNDSILSILLKKKNNNVTIHDFLSTSKLIQFCLNMLVLLQ